ncbi:MAG: AMP-binding protein, partial [Acidimicrobiia bacterium]|nr:AMP-binding protein [Acidimicrobiia bacterium]
IVMPMSIEAVSAYLATIWLGGAVVSIADSFAPHEIATRLRIGDADLVVTQDVIRRSDKVLPMYERVVASGAPAIVSVDTGAGVPLRPQDLTWQTLMNAPPSVEPVICSAGDHINILFSSGTTGDPKAVPWTQATPLKAAMDGHFHQDIHPSDVVAWPTNLGWMMGPWLIFASMINGASMALYDDIPTGRGFAEFIGDARVTILGVVPSLVSAWRANGATDGVDWSAIRLYSSTGEASDPADMGWLMDVAGGKPVIEYCGGTEIGGGYITGTVLQDAVPGTFTTPSLGLDIRLLDDKGSPAPVGEVFLVPPSIGLSDTLLNRDHHLVYFDGLPAADVPLRRHGDQMEALEGGRYRALGRVDDTMNLGGIKVSSAEIERAASAVPGITECAAIGARPPGGGPSRLVLYVVLAPGVTQSVDVIRTAIQTAIRADLNPLFKVDDVVIVDQLPRTASAKVMRRSLRAAYSETR